MMGTLESINTLCYKVSMIRDHWWYTESKSSWDLLFLTRYVPGWEHSPGRHRPLLCVLLSTIVKRKSFSDSLSYTYSLLLGVWTTRLPWDLIKWFIEFWREGLLWPGEMCMGFESIQVYRTGHNLRDTQWRPIFKILMLLKGKGYSWTLPPKDSRTRRLTDATYLKKRLGRPTHRCYSLFTNNKIRWL